MQRIESDSLWIVLPYIEVSTTEHTHTHRTSHISLNTS